VHGVCGERAARWVDPPSWWSGRASVQSHPAGPIYRNSRDLLRFVIGDVRDYTSIQQAVREADVVLHAAALKEVPACEYAPFDAVLTNIICAQNIVRSVLETETAV